MQMDTRFQEILASLRANVELEKVTRVIGYSRETFNTMSKLLLQEHLLLREEVDESEFRRFVEQATEDAAKFDSLQYALSIRLMVDMPISPSMRHWIAANLSGSIARPKSRGGPNSLAGDVKGILLAACVHKAVDMGLHPTRGPVSKPESAIDAVVHLLAERGHHLTYDVVAKAWNRFRPDGPPAALGEMAKALVRRLD